MTITWQLIGRGSKQQRVLIEFDAFTYKKAFDDFYYIKGAINESIVWVPKKKLEFKEDHGFAKRCVFYSVYILFEDKSSRGKSFRSENACRASVEYWKRHRVERGVKNLFMWMSAQYCLDIGYTSNPVGFESKEECII